MVANVQAPTGQPPRGQALRDELAELIRPRARILPSQWAERHRSLKKGTTANPGRWRNSYLPWLEAILDAFIACTWADGIVVMKAAQVGGSEILVTLLGYLFATDPGPTLFLCTTQDIAREFALDRFEHMIESTPVLRRVFLAGKKNRETILVKPAIGGKLIVAGAGSPNKLISRPIRYVALDEEDRLPTFAGIGSGRELAEKRVQEFSTRQRTGIFSIAHPTNPDVGVAQTYRDETDRREWRIKCAHCSAEFTQSWEHVDTPTPDPADAIYRCPLCSEELSDAQRWAASRRGRFMATRGADEPEPRFVGFRVSRLDHPRVTLAEIARVFLACRTEAELRVFHNMVLGLPYREASIVLTADDVKAKVDPRGTPRRCPADTWAITLGTDVQKGTEVVTLYYVIVAWTRNGNAVVLEYGKLLGWAAQDALLVRFEAAQAGRQEPRRIRAAAIDYGWKTREVYEFCRRPHGGVPCVPVKHTPTVTRDEPTRRKQTKDPLHPELGHLTRLELCRDHWLDRTLGRLQSGADPAIGGSTVLPPTTSPELINHLTANTQVEITDRHGHLKRTWQRDEDRSDDYAQAFVYAEVAAVGLGLDRVHEAIPPTPAHDESAETRGHVERPHRAAKRGGYIRGRRGRAR